MNQDNITNNLKSFRKKLGLRQIDVAAMLGHASSDRISHWEKGMSVPSLVNLFKLTVIYKTSPQELYDEMHASIVRDLQGWVPSIEECRGNKLLSIE